MRYRIKHVTEYLYSERVSHCYNLAHMIPRNSLRQKCVRSDISVSPFSAHSARREDYYGNQAYHFEVQRPHKKLVITATSEVVTGEQKTSIDLDFGITCQQALDLIQRSFTQFQSQPQNTDLLMAREFLLESGLVKCSPELTAQLIEYAQPSFEPDRPLLSAVLDLTRRIYRDFTYSPESTTIATPLEEVLQKRQGVCQDFAHFQIGCLRALGFPAKYVSGYIETVPPQGREKLVGADASHAWISVYSPTEGWFEFDPTNDCLAAEQHIITAWGRDFFDVTPLKGVIFGGGKSPVLNVSVDVSQLG